MRFFLDQDVDVAVGRILRHCGHECWTANDANLSEAADDDLTVYASEQHAIVVTHDREFSQRRSRHVIGRHLQLRCEEPDAADLIAEHLDDVVRLLQSAEDVMIQASPDGIQAHYRWS